MTMKTSYTRKQPRNSSSSRHSSITAGSPSSPSSSSSSSVGFNPFEKKSYDHKALHETNNPFEHTNPFETSRELRYSSKKGPKESTKEVTATSSGEEKSPSSNSSSGANKFRWAARRIARLVTTSTSASPTTSDDISMDERNTRSEPVPDFASSTDGFSESEMEDDDDILLALTPPRTREFTPRIAEYHTPGRLGIEFEPSSDGFGLVVKSLQTTGKGLAKCKASSDEVRVGDLLTHINGEVVVEADGFGAEESRKALDRVKEKRPLLLTFTEHYLRRDVIAKPPAPLAEEVCESGDGPDELILVDKPTPEGRQRVLVRQFRPVSGVAKTHGIRMGDQLAFINGLPVGVGCKWVGEEEFDSDLRPGLEDVYQMLSDKRNYPMGLTFARKRGGSGQGTHGVNNAFTDDDAETILVSCDRSNRLGCVFDMTSSGDVFVSDMHPVPGVFHRALAKYMKVSTATEAAADGGMLHLAIDSINGQSVSSYATAEVVQKSLHRHWRARGKVDLCMCDDERKVWAESLCSMASC